MGLSNWAAAFLLLGSFIVAGVAGISAMDASHTATNETLADNNVSKPPELAMGEEVQSSLAAALPWLGLAAVPLGILGILGLAALRFPTDSQRMGR